MKTRLLLLLLLLLTSSTAAQSDRVTVRVAIPQPANLDPVTISRFDYHKPDLIENLLIGLTRLNPSTGSVEPQLATDWTVSPDGLTWTFNLRDDVQWVEVIDGEAVAVRPVVAADVVFAIQRACDPNRPSPLTPNMAVINGCLDTTNAMVLEHVNQTWLDQHIGVRAIDDQTLQVELLFPAAYFLTMTTLPEFRPLPRERVMGTWPLATTILTSGAWVVQEWDAEHMLLVSNPFWPLEREGNLEQVDIRFDEDPASIPVRLTSGAVDVARLDTDGATTARLGNPDLIQSTTGRTVALVGFSFEYPPLDNPLVRQALAQAINREQLAQMLSGYAAISTLTLDNVIATPGIEGIGFDPTAAANALGNAGYPQCENFPAQIMLAVEDDELAIRIGQFIVTQWNQHLGCADIFQVGTASAQALVNTAHGTIDASEESTVARFQTWLLTWTADYPDANGWTADALHCTYGYFRTGRNCDVNDTLLDQASVTMDLQSRFTTYRQAELGFFGPNGSFPIIPLVVSTAYWGQQSWVLGIAAYGPFQFDRWTIE